MCDAAFSPVNHWTCRHLVYDVDDRCYHCRLTGDTWTRRGEINRPTDCRKWSPD